MGDSPAKKLNFEPIGKENIPISAPAPIMDDLNLKKSIVEKFDEKKQDKSAVAPTIKSEEAHEPLLQENPHRFVLFPIKYHEVCSHRRVTRKVVSSRPSTDTDYRYGRCTRKPKPLSGLPRR